MVQVSASLLAADFACLGKEVVRAEHAGVNSFHFDMMDGHYVSNIALAPDHLSALRPYTTLPFHVHLELANPNEVLEHFRPLKANLIIACRNTLDDPEETFARIRACGANTGLSLNPDEPIEETHRLLPELDLLMIMGVFPGFGGQSMDPNTILRIAQARDEPIHQPAPVNRRGWWGQFGKCPSSGESRRRCVDHWHRPLSCAQDEELYRKT